MSILGHLEPKKVFGFFEAQARNFAHYFDDGNFLGSVNSGQHDVEFVFFFSGSGTSSSGGSGNSYGRGNSFYAEFFFNRFHEFGKFQYGQFRNRVY